MSYDKLSLASFKDGLKANKYVNATGARRAVGKATTLSDADKEKARAAIDAHFGSASAAPAPKKAPAALAKKTAAPKKVAAKKAAAAPKKTAAAAAPKKTPAPKKAASKAPRTSTPSIPSAAVSGTGLDIENTSSIATQMRIAEKTIQNVGAALSVITQAKERYPDADLGDVVEEMGGTLAGAVAIFRQVVNSLQTDSKSAIAAPALAPRPVAPTGVVNNGVVPSRAESLFQESSPEAAQPVATG